MDKNQEIFEKARYLGLNLDGETEEEQLKNIAHQVGISNYNPHLEQNSLSKKLDDLYENRFNDYFNHNIDFENLFMDKDANKISKQNTSSKNYPSWHRNLLSYDNDDNTKKKLKESKKQLSYYFPQINNQYKDNQNKSEDTVISNKNNLVQRKTAKEGLKALGIPSFLANPISKSLSETNSERGNINSINSNINVKMISIGFLFVMIIILIITLSIAGMTSQDDESQLNENSTVTSYITGVSDFSELSDTLVYMNLCFSNKNHDKEVEDCLDSPAGKYFTHLRELYNAYKLYTDRNGNPVELNIGLILETISYDISDMELFSDDNLEKILTQADELAEAQVEKYQEIGNLYTLSSKTCTVKKNQIVKGENGETSYYRISNNKFISYLLYGKVHENYSGNVKVYDVNLHPLSDDSCVPEGQSYKSIVEDSEITSYDGNEKDGYIYNKVTSKYNITADKIIATNMKIVEEIYKRAKENYNAGTASSNFICSGVMVTGDSAGVYSLEDYVAGVVQRENNWYQGDNIENMKAQAIAARTYVLRVTTNCTLPIENTATKQTFNPNPSDEAKRAALETANQILVNDNGDYISTEYDAFAVKEITEEFYILKQANLQIPIEWVTSNISSANLEYYETHSHGRGMSQWGSRYLQTQGYSYDQILSTFYPTGKLTTIGNSITGNIPSNVNDLKNRYYFNFDINIYQGNTLFGQCVWYAKHRAMEILSASSLDEGTKKLLINSIYATGGNGQDWFKNPSNTYFKKSTNINEPKAGAIVSWTRGQYGHVAIIERVYTGENGVTMVTLTEGWRTKNSSGSGWYVTNDLWSVVNFRKKELTLSQLQTYSGIFNGYVYLY